MNYFSTRDKSKRGFALADAAFMGLAPDGGLFLPERIPQVDMQRVEQLAAVSYADMALYLAQQIFDDVDAEALERVVRDAYDFPIEMRALGDGLHTLELFHGPTLAFKDVGGRFMARLLSHFIQGNAEKQVNVLVATSGDTGSAVAIGFLGVPGIHVYVFYPKGMVSEIQEKQFTTLGQNITAIEVDGCFDDCQALVKAAFMDEELNKRLKLTSANSINIARFLPQAFYYFNAYAQLKRMGKEQEMVVAVPSGNFGNLTAGLFGKHMGLPIKRFIAANNSNDIVYKYLQTGKYEPRASVCTIANAKDVGNPSNFARILDFYNESHEAICKDLSGAAYSDAQIEACVKQVWAEEGYLLDPHGACGYQALKEGLKDGEVGVFLETAHPAKFKDTIERIIGEQIEIPAKLQEFMKGEKQSIPMSPTLDALKQYLLG